MSVSIRARPSAEAAAAADYWAVTKALSSDRLAQEPRQLRNHLFEFHMKSFAPGNQNFQFICRHRDAPFLSGTLK